MTEQDWLNAKTGYDLVHALIFRNGPEREGVVPWGPAASARKLRLLCAACCREIACLVGEFEADKAIRLGEALADGLMAEADRVIARQDMDKLVWGESPEEAVALGGPDWPASARNILCLLLDKEPSVFCTLEILRHFCVLRADYSFNWDRPWPGGDEEEYYPCGADAQKRLVGEIFGNPFREVAWRGPLLEEVTATATPDGRFANWVAWVCNGNRVLAWQGGRVRAMAEEIYEGRWEDMPVLADALEDAGCGNGPIHEHLRSGETHVKGCWALDLLLGKS